MKIEFRLTEKLYTSIQDDLSRKHPFAAERVGFVGCASGSLDGGGLVLLAESYFPIADEHYIDDPYAGATIGSAAIRAALQVVYNNPVSMFHVHRHEHRGVPRFSKVDLRESHRLVPDFFKVQRTRSHGAIVLSHDSACGLCWRPGLADPTPISTFSVVGKPTKIMRTGS